MFFNYEDFLKHILRRQKHIKDLYREEDIVYMAASLFMLSSSYFEKKLRPLHADVLIEIFRSIYD